jgi:hypothetical protein
MIRTPTFPYGIFYFRNIIILSTRSIAMPTTTTATATPILLSATPTLGTGGTTIDLVFDMAMAAGSGTIIITDGAVQTVIDRATGQPTMRVVGATDTHTVSAASVSIDGTHVKLTVEGLLPGHPYSIVMGSGVLLSSGLVPFAGVRTTSQLQFTAPTNADHEGPSFVSASADATLLKADGSLKVTLTFSEAVSGLTADALHAPNATVSALTASGDGHTWIATLVPSGPVEQAVNALTIDMSKVHDTVGNAGAGTSNVASYAVDTRAPTGAAIAFDGTLLKAGAGVGVTFTFSEAVKGFTAAAITAPHAVVGNLVSIDDGHTWTATLTATDPNTSSGNQLGIDMGQLQDLNGNAGSGSFVSSASYAVDTVGPEAPAIALQGGLVSRSDSVAVVFTFKEQVTLDTGAVIAPNATVQELHTTDGGTTWVALLRPGAPVEASGNTLSLDMSKVHDAAGNAGSGSVPAADAYAVDSKGPTASITLDGTDLRYGASIVATIALSDAVGEAALRAALSQPNAEIQALSSTDGGKTWNATLVSKGSAVSATNALSLDLTQLHDAHGNAGVAAVQSPNYTADNAVSAHIASNIWMVDYGSDEGDYLTNEADQTFSFTLSGSPGYGDHIELSIDGQAVSSDSLRSEGDYYWYQDSTTTHFADGAHTFSARVVDSAGHASAAVTRQFTIETVKPTLAQWPEGALMLGAPDALELKLSEAVYMPFPTATSILFTDDDGGASVEVALDPSFLSADGKTLTIRAGQHHLQAGKNYHFTLPEGLYDLAGNNVVATPLSVHVVSDDLQAPSAIAATAQIGKGIYGIGAQIEIAVAFDEAVKVAGSGQPVLNLSNGGVAAFHALSGDKQTMYFTYTVGAGNEDDSGNLQLNGSAGLVGHVSDLAGNLLDLAHIDFSSLGNLSASGYGGPIQIDAHASPAPGAPVLAIASDTGTLGDGLTNLGTPSLSGSGTASFATVKLFEGDTLLASTNSNADGSWTMTNDAWSYGRHLDDGAHTLVVRQYDSANNESAASGTLAVAVDTVAPNKPGAPVLATASDTGVSDHDGLTGDATPTLSGMAAEAGGKIELYLNGGATALASADVGAGGAWSLTVPDNLALADGVASLTVRQVDAAGNRGVSSDALAITIDKSAPAVLAKAVLDAASDSGISSSDGITNIRTPKLTGTALAAGTIEVYDGATLIGTTEVQADKTWSFTVGSDPARLLQFADGAHDLTVRQVDTAGNRSAASSVLSVTVDTVGPTLKNSELEWNSDKHRFELKFSEQIVFAANAAIDVLDSLNLLKSHHTGNVRTNWEIGNGDAGVGTVLELNLGTLFGLFGHFHLKADTSAIQDVAGNVAVIGTPTFDLPGHL